MWGGRAGRRALECRTDVMAPRVLPSGEMEGPEHASRARRALCKVAWFLTAGVESLGPGFRGWATRMGKATNGAGPDPSPTRSLELDRLTRSSAALVS